MIQELQTNLLGKKVVSVFSKEEMKDRNHFYQKDEKWMKNPNRPRIVCGIYITQQNYHSVEPRFLLVDEEGLFYDYAHSEVKLYKNGNKKKIV